MALFDNFMERVFDSKLGPRRPEAQDPRVLSDAYSNLQQSLNQNIQADKQKHEMNIDPTKEAYQAPDNLERWKMQIDGMLKSGNPTLQKQGMGMLEKYHQKATAAPVAEKRSSSAQIAVDLGLKPGTAPFNKFVKSHALKSGTTINVGKDGPAKVRYLTKEEKIEGGLNPDVPYVLDSQGNPKPVAKGAQEEDITKTNILNTQVDELESMLFGEEGIFGGEDAAEAGGVPAYLRRMVEGNVQSYTKDDPRYADYSDYAGGVLSNFARSLGGEKGALAEGDVQRVQKLLPQVTGFNPDTATTAKAKMKKLKALQAAFLKKGGLDSSDINQILGTSTDTVVEQNLPELPPGYTWDD